MAEILLSLGQSVLEEGLIYAVMALGVYISYSILDFPDLSVDGTFPFGAVVSAILILNGVNPWLVLIVAFIGGCLCGMVTGFLHVKLGITDLLSGILVMTALYSVNLSIASDRVMVPLGLTAKTIFNSGIAMLFPKSIRNITVLLIGLLIILICKFALDYYFKTKSGMLIRAVGDNHQVVTSLAKDTRLVKVLGLALGNGFGALAGAILCQKERLADINKGTGMIVMGLAAVIIGTSIFKRMSFVKATTMVILGMIIYRGCVMLALNLGLPTSLMKLVMAVIFTIALVLNKSTAKGGRKNAKA